jgi:hypothetical protein
MPHLTLGHLPNAILQPPRPEIIPLARLLQLAAERDTEPDREAAD